MPRCKNCTVEEELEYLKDNLDAFFLVINGMIVLLMQPGFALLECGSVRSKNATNIILKNMLDASMAFWLVGYAFAFGKGNFFLGYQYFAAHDLPDKCLHLWFYQYVFAATASTIVSGSMAERCDTTAYFVYSTVITGFLYPIIVHWAWTPEGWLKVGDGQYNFHDFGGSGVVHLCGGTCALVGAMWLGPRFGRFGDPVHPVEHFRGHSVPLSITGGMILLVGFLAFNGASQERMSRPGDGMRYAAVVCNATLSACFGGLVTLFLVRMGILGEPKVFSVLHSMNGALCGMVAVGAGVDLFQMWSAAITGALASFWYLYSYVLVIKAKIDDPMAASAVHMSGGIWGLLACPIFRAKDGILTSWNKAACFNLLWNIIGCLAIISWSAVLSAIMFGSLKKMKLLRVSAEIEMKGLDLAKHNEPAYPAESWFEEQYEEWAVKRKQSKGTQVEKKYNLPPHMGSSITISLESLSETETNTTETNIDSRTPERQASIRKRHDNS